MSNDLILALETATRGGSLALMRGGLLVASSTGIAEDSHSINLLSRIESLLKEAHVALRDVGIFATAAGPGSFTGLRIGLATMKAFSATFNRPCVGVPTLDAIAFAAGVSECTYALLPAGRGEVFAQVFTLGARASRPPRRFTQGVVIERAGETPALPVHIPPHVLLERISDASSILWAGPGAHLYKDLIQQRADELGIEFEELNGRNPTVREGPSASSTVPGRIRWTLALNIEQLAEYVAILALRRVNDSHKHRPEDLRAIYVRPSDAELKE